eukprot:2395775-Karenia_brevis.AAC.1
MEKINPLPPPAPDAPDMDCDPQLPEFISTVQRASGEWPQVPKEVFLLCQFGYPWEMDPQTA